MKKFTLILLTITSCGALAQDYRTMDVINNSNLPITVTYDECQSEIANGSTLYNCTEKTSVISKKNSGANFISYPNREENDKSPNVWILKKIVSSLGEQDFIFVQTDSLDEYSRLAQDPKKGFKICLVMNKSLEGLSSTTLVLDNFGTNKFHCQHLSIW